MILNITKGGLDFTVQDSRGTGWGFWPWWSGDQWEPTTIEETERLLAPDGLLLDIGAWVGPLTLWAAKKIRARVVAVEPDPNAFEQLAFNVEASGVGDRVTLLQCAVAPAPGPVSLAISEEGGGDAYSSLTRELPRAIAVQGRTLSNLVLEYHPTLVKMDIEGGESLILPRDGHVLRRLGLPLLLALHPDWYAQGTEAAMEAELARWNVKDLHNEMYLLTPGSQVKRQ